MMESDPNIVEKLMFFTLKLWRYKTIEMEDKKVTSKTLGRIEGLKIERSSDLRGERRRIGRVRRDWNKKVKTALVLGLKGFSKFNKCCCVNSPPARAKTAKKFNKNQVIYESIPGRIYGINEVPFLFI